MKINIISRLLIFSMIAVGFSSCCNGISEKTYPDLKSYTDEARTHVEFISQVDFKKVLDAQGSFNLLDCREAENYGEATIPNAVNVPRGMIGFSEKIQNRHIPTYVFSDIEDKSILAAASLKLIKYAKVIVISGNWEEWKTNYPDDIQLEPGGGHEEAAAPEEEEGGCGG